MKTAKEQLADAIKLAGGLRSLRVGSRLFVFTEATRKQAEFDAHRYAMRSGEMIYAEDGSRVFYKWSAIENAGESGSARYDWHDDGNRVRQAFQQVVVIDNRVTSCRTIKQAFRKLEVA